MVSGALIGYSPFTNRSIEVTPRRRDSAMSFAGVPDFYGQLDKPAYANFEPNPEYAENHRILKWWTPKHDALLRRLILEKRWTWHWYVAEEIIKITDANQIVRWKKSDVLCHHYAWYNVLMYFAAARAQKKGLTRSIRAPQWKRCLSCKRKFVENSLPIPLIERLGIDELDFCAPCLCDAVLPHTGSDNVSKAGVLQYLKKLSHITGRVPPQNFGEGIEDLRAVPRGKRAALVRLLQNKPTVRCVKLHFRSWLNALVRAGVLEDGTRKTPRGIQTIGRDGHVCLSLGEKTIDDFLHKHRIRHAKESPYPEGNYRADFRVGDVLIEYFGLAGDRDYDKKAREKMGICKKHGIALITIYAEDLINERKLEEKLSLIAQSAARSSRHQKHEMPSRSSALASEK